MKTRMRILGWLLISTLLAAAQTASSQPSKPEECNILTLLDESKIEVKAYGNRIQWVTVEVRRLLPERVVVLIPVGTVFASDMPHCQDMVVTVEKKCEVTHNQWQRMDVAVVCANMTKAIPGLSTTFTIKGSPELAELPRLLSVLNDADVGFSVRQAATWIVTDDADYTELGRLTLLGGDRIIDKKHAVEAMRFCAVAQVEISRKAIWKENPGLIFHGFLLDEPKREWSMDMAAELGYRGSPEEILVIALRTDLNAAVRREAVSVLAEMEPSHAVEPLIAALNDSDESVRLTSIRALEKLGDSRAALPLVDALLIAEDSAAISAVAEALTALADSRSVEPLIAIVNRKKGCGSRRAAMDVLAKLNDSRAVEPLLAVLKSRKNDVQDRGHAALALGQLGDTRAFESLAKAMKDRDETMRSYAVRGLGLLGDQRAYDYLVSALLDRNVQVRDSAMEALEHFNDPRVVDLLISILNSDSTLNVRAGRAAQMLGASGDPRALEPLLAALKGPNESLRYDAARGLKQLADPRAIGPLREVLSATTNEELKSFLLSILRTLEEP